MDLDAVFRYVIPHWHPLAVHLPLVLLPLAAGAALGYAVRGTAVWRRAALLLLLLAAPSAWWTEETGEALYEAVEGEPQVERFIETHETAAAWTVWAAAMALLAALAAEGLVRRRPVDLAAPATPRDPVGLRLLVLLPAGAAALAVALAGHIGAVMVWGVPR